MAQKIRKNRNPESINKEKIKEKKLNQNLYWFFFKIIQKGQLDVHWEILSMSKFLKTDF